MNNPYDTMPAFMHASLPRFGLNQRKPVVVAYLSGDMVHSDFTMALGMLMAYSIAIPKIWTALNNTRCSVIDHGRNVALQQVYTGDCSHILFLDSDMTYPANTLHRLLSHNKDIVGASYCTRVMPHGMVHRNLNKSSTLPPIENYSNDAPGSALHEVQSLGGGCLLIRREVLDAFPLPVFQSLWISTEIPQGEDRGFCLKARELGFKVWMDVPLTYEMGHCGMKIYTWRDVDFVLSGEEPI